MNIEKFFYDSIQKNRNKKMLADREVLALQHIEKFPVAVDLGCGDGLLVKYASQYCEHCFGVDISFNGIRSIEHAENRGCQSNLNNTLPIKNNSVNAFFLLDVIEHVFSPEHIVSEIHRCLTKNGVLYISTPNMRQLNRIFSILKGRFPKTSDDPGWDGGHIHYFCSKDIIALLRSYGFSIQINTGILPRSQTFTRQKIKQIIKKIFPEYIRREFFASAFFIKAVKK